MHGIGAQRWELRGKVSSALSSDKRPWRPTSDRLLPAATVNGEHGTLDGALGGSSHQQALLVDDGNCGSQILGLQSRSS